MNKLCCMCKKNRRLTSFFRDKSKKDGFKVYCKDCDNSFKRRIDKEFRNERSRKRLAINRNQMNDSYWKRISRRHCLPYELLKSIYRDQLEKCFYCFIYINSSNLHIDHYFPQSDLKIVIACEDCNRLKWQRNGDEFIFFLKSYISRFS